MRFVLDPTSPTGLAVDHSSVTVVGGGGGGGNVSDWGDIGGTLSNQSDLQSALDDKQDVLAEGPFVDGDKTALDNATLNTDTSLSGNSYFLDEDTMTSNDATKVPSQQSVKAYTDNEILNALSEPYVNPEGLVYYPEGNSGYFDTWYSALANAKTQAIDVLLLGDSITGTIFNPSTAGDSFTWDYEQIGLKFSRILNRKLGVPTEPERGWIMAKGDSSVPSFTTNAGSNPSPLASFGLGYWASENEDSEDATIVHNMTHISIVYGKHPDGGELVIRDGGVSGTILATIDTSGTEKSSFVWTSNNLGYASHTIYLEVNCAAGETVRLEGAYVHVSLSTSSTDPVGVRVWNAAHGGAVTNGFTANPQIYRDFIDNKDPDLIIVATGTNDDVANIQSRLEALHAQIQAATSAPILQWIPTVSSGFSNAEIDLVKAACATSGVPWIDSTNIVGALGQTGNPNNQEGLHPATNGRKTIAMHLAMALSGDPLSVLTTETSRRAPLTNPNFPGKILVGGTSILDGGISAASNNFTAANLLGYLGFDLKEPGNTETQIQFCGAVFNAFFNGISGAGISFGSGSAVRDVYMYRSAANILSLATGDSIDARIRPRAGTTTSSATPTINTDNVDVYVITAQAVDITSMTTNLSGTPTNGQRLHIAITGTAARAITWGASFEASTVALPATTVTTNRLDCDFIWNAATSKWRILQAV